jgi:hypothetical protein
MTKRSPSPEPEDHWAAYFAAQLPAQAREEGRRAAEAKAEQAQRDGVYERALEIIGTVKWKIEWQVLRTGERF